MASRRTRIGLTLAVLAALAVAGCFDSESDRIAGGGGVETTEGNVVAVGTALVGPAGARVSLIPAEFDPLRDRLPDSLTVVADAKGAYRFRGLAPGRYNLEAYLPSAGTRCFRPGVVIAKGDRTIEGTDTLTAPGRLHLGWDGVKRGVLTQKGRNFRLDLTGSDADAGGILLDSLPAGLLPPFFFTLSSDPDPSDSATRLFTDSVRIAPGILDSIPFQEEWAHSAVLTWDASSVPPDSLDGYPLLVRLTRPEFPFGDASHAGTDLRFTTMDGNPLPFSVESWDSAAGHAEIWVRLKAQPAGNPGTLRMDWGSASSASPTGSVFDSASGYAGVWHFAQAGSGGSGLTADSGPFFLRTATVGLTPDPLGAIGAAQRFDGVGAYAYAANVASVQKPSHMYVSAWIAPDTTGIPTGTPPQDRAIISKWDDADSTGFILEYLPHFNGIRLYMGFGGKASNLDANLPKDSLPNAAAWHLVAATYDGNEAAIWWDGKELLRWTFGPGDLPANTRDIMIGARRITLPVDSTVDFFRGRMDEARMLFTVPSKTWLELDYRTQKPGANMIGFQQLK
jgi:hypothetical protein